VATTTLALGSRQMSAYGAIVSRLAAIEVKKTRISRIETHIIVNWQKSVDEQSWRNGNSEWSKYLLD
jgi:hypothetical protein